MIVKDNIVVYGAGVELREDAAYGHSFRDTGVRLDNATFYNDENIEYPIPFFIKWYNFDGANFSLNTEGVVLSKIHIAELIKNQANLVEFSGIDVNGNHIKTDFASQQYINGMYTSSKLNNSFSNVNFICGDGTWVEFDAAAISEVATAVFQHVEACFDRRRQLLIECENITDYDSMLLVMSHIDTNWPANI